MDNSLAEVLLLFLLANGASSIAGSWDGNVAGECEINAYDLVLEVVDCGVGKLDGAVAGAFTGRLAGVDGEVLVAIGVNVVKGGDFMFGVRPVVGNGNGCSLHNNDDNGGNVVFGNGNCGLAGVYMV